MKFSEADPDLIKFLNDFYANYFLKLFSIQFGGFYGNFIKNEIFSLLFQAFNKVLGMLINNLKLDGRSRHQIPKLSLQIYY